MISSGSGTTLVAAKNLGKGYMGDDISEDALHISLRRLEHGEQRA
jgi:DNA modification methylase